MSPYPVEIEVRTPEKFARMQLLLRCAFAIAIGYVGISLGWLFGLLYLVLPIFAAVVVSQKGGEAYVRDSRPLQRVLAWVIAFYGYMLFVTDRFPTDAPDPSLRVDIRPLGTPTVGSALARLLTSLPAALVLVVLACVSGIVVLVTAIIVLFVERMPATLHAFQRGLLRWQARLLVYHASLVDVYPPFAFDSYQTGHEQPGAL